MTAFTPTHASGALRALALGPLLASIGREIQERSDQLALLLVQRDRRRGRRTGCNDGAGLLEAECATHRVELRRAHQELVRLGCHLVSLRPQVFSVRTGQGNESVLFYCRDATTD